MGNVTVQTYAEPYELSLEDEWSVTGYPFDDYAKLQQFVDRAPGGPGVNGRGMAIHGPIVLSAVFDVSTSDIQDTYINMAGWGKVSRRSFS